ncbi:AhpC/TSA family protein [Streptomyces sp. NA04227]|uniref:peroxiredoxin-like family protein n=1 Tax=Streptomyces sp. NA04227 TaxID=2742136 RepID=UPI0015928B21|nr:peroxiredoxin-like family protein [Streptomyces sp. NA04227]QKW07981.1 AhpC/TSA family protein [Streptomyces sp. NA04227]
MSRSLREELRELYENGHLKLPEDVLKVMSEGALELVESGMRAHALSVGAAAPRFTLPTASGRTAALDDLLAEGPVVLTFYRGAWCPYCNLALRALQRHLDAFTARGARLVAISPQIPDESLALSERESLGFDVLSDIGSEVAERFGIAFDLSADLGALYDRLGFDLQRVNDGHARTLPLPATYVIDREGVIRWAFVETDYTVRAEPADILAALDGLGGAE